MCEGSVEVDGDTMVAKSVVLPPFSPTETVLLELCAKGHMAAYLRLWEKYYDVVPKSGVTPEVVAVKESERVAEVDVARSASVSSVTASTRGGSVSSSGDSDVVVTSAFKKRSAGSTVSRVEPKRVTSEQDATAKTPWRFGKKIAKTLTDREIAKYGDGACYLHLVRAEKAADVIRKKGTWLDLAGFLAIPIEYLIPRTDMRTKAVSVSKKNIHISGASNSGWSFYTVLQAAVSAGMKAPLLDGLEPGYGDLRIDGSFKLGGMVTAITELVGLQVNRVEVSRTSAGLAGTVAWSFDDGKSAVIVQVPMLNGSVGDVVVERDKNVLRVGQVSSAVVDLVFPFSLTKQVVSWEVTGRIIKRLVVSVTGSLVDDEFFPYAPVSRTVVKNKVVTLASVDPGEVFKTACDVVVVDTLDHAKTLFTQGFSMDKVTVYGTVGPASRICYWPTLLDKSETKMRVKRLYGAATSALLVVGGMAGMTSLSGLQPSVNVRYHRWYELHMAGAVALGAFSKVLVQSDVGYAEAVKLFQPEVDAGSVVVEQHSVGIDCRGHTVCVFIEDGAIMDKALVRELWCGEGKEYVCLSSTEQPVDWFY